MKVFVAIRTDIAPDVRIVHGGGEIGWATVVGASLNRESTEKLCEDELRRRYLQDNIELDEGITFEEYKENSAPYFVRYDIKECDLIRENLTGNY